METTVQSAVLFDVLAVFVKRSRSDALQFAARESRLENVGRVHCAFCGSGSNDRVQFVDENDHIARALDFIHHRLDPLFELAAILRARDHQGEVQSDDALVDEDLWNDAAGDFQGEPLDDGGFANARFSDQNWVILSATAENLDHPPNLGLASNHWIQLAIFRKLRQIATEGFESWRLRFLLLFSALTRRRRDRLFGFA